MKKQDFSLDLLVEGLLSAFDGHQLSGIIVKAVTNILILTPSMHT